MHICLNRPDAPKAMSLQTVAELRQVLKDAEATTGTPDAVRVVVLRGAGGHFCAAADLNDMAGARMRAMQAAGTGATDPIAEVNAAFGELCAADPRTPLAVVAVLEGTVMGGGLGLAGVADVTLASQTTPFRMPEASLGVVPTQITPFQVERLGYSQAKRLAATKALMAQARLRAPHDLVQSAAAVFSQAAQSPEGPEGMTTFIQKRKPQWAMP